MVGRRRTGTRPKVPGLGGHSHGLADVHHRRSLRRQHHVHAAGIGESHRPLPIQRYRRGTGADGDALARDLALLDGLLAPVASRLSVPPRARAWRRSSAWRPCCHFRGWRAWVLSWTCEARNALSRPSGGPPVWRRADDRGASHHPKPRAEGRGVWPPEAASCRLVRRGLHACFLGEGSPDLSATFLQILALVSA